MLQVGYCIHGTNASSHHPTAAGLTACNHRAHTYIMPGNAQLQQTASQQNFNGISYLPMRRVCNIGTMTRLYKMPL